MAKKVIGKIKLQIQAGKANPSPPIGPALGQHGVNIMDFCKQYNSQTENMAGYVVPVEITVYEDRSFTFITYINYITTTFYIKEKYILKKDILHIIINHFILKVNLFY